MFQKAWSAGLGVLVRDTEKAPIAARRPIQDILKHDKNIEEESMKYSSDVNRLCKYTMSIAFCLPFVVTPKSNQFAQSIC